MGTFLQLGKLGSTRFVGDRCMIFTAGGNAIGGAYLRTCSHPHTGNIVTVGVIRNSRIMSIHLAGNRGRLVLTGHGNHTIHFSRGRVHAVKHASANIHNVHLSRNSSTLVNVVMIGSPRGRAIVMMDRRNCNGHSSMISCHMAGHNNGNIGALGVARGANHLITVGGIASRGSLVVVGRDNVIVHLTITSYHIVNHTARNIHLVGLAGGGSIVTDMYGIVDSRLRTSMRRRDHST